MRRNSFTTFLAGALSGLIAGGAAGGGFALYMFVKHPHFVAQLKADLLQPSSQSTVIGDLGAVVVTVDASAAGEPISPYIYGISSGNPAALRALNATVNRWGGNPSTRYNWVIGHAWNAARDWEFRNGNYGHPSGSVSDQFVTESLAAGATPLVSIPSIGWVAKDDNNSSRSINVPAQGGPPVSPGSRAIPGYDPTSNQHATSVLSLPQKTGPFVLAPPPSSTVIYQDEWVHELVSRFGAAPRGVGFFSIDNEPDLWSYTDTDVHPVRMGYADMLNTYEAYASAVKAQDPNALLLGPDVSGWTGYWYSDLDRGNDNFATHADRAAHGNQPFLPWWLGQVAQADRQRGSRSLDLLDVHYYPQASGVFSEAHDPQTQALRIRSVRSLDSPSYVDESWIGTQVDLIPRLKQWIAAQYPGTGLAITEYNWGGEKDASGAVALAEVLGIFGRDGVDLATYWTYPPPNSPAGAAFRIYRNFDGNGATFGDISLPVKVNQAGVAAFASRHSNAKEVDVVLVNEAPSQTATVKLALKLNAPRSVTQYQLAAGSSALTATALSSVAEPVMKLPAYSVTLIKVMER